MASYRSQEDLIAYISRLEDRIARLESSAIRIDRVTARASIPAANVSPGRIIFDTTAGRLYAGDNAGVWNALW